MSSVHKGKWAAITGAANGIGKAIANKCASFGINVILIDIDETALNLLNSEFARKYPLINVLSYKCDVSDVMSVTQMITKFKTDSINLNKSRIIVHFLFNNAGVSSFTNVLTGDLKRMQKTMDINLFGMIYITNAFLPFLKEINNNNDNHNISAIDDDRYIINTSSVAGLATGDSFYSVTKHGVCALTETIKMELKKYNKKCIKENNRLGYINVSCLIPSYVKSSFFESVAKIHGINVLDELNKTKIYNSGKPNPKMWKANGIDPSIVADIVFEEGIKKKLFWIHTHPDWSKCVAIDRFYSIYTQKFNQYEATRKVFNKYKENMEKIVQKKSKL